MLVDSIFQVLGSGLKLWSSKEVTKYLDKYIALKKEWYEEVNKPESEQDHAKLDNLKFELKLLCGGFSSQVGIPDASDKSKS